MIFLCVPLVIIFFMLGGQINKLFRPIGVSLGIFGIYLSFYPETFLLALPAFLYGAILTIGYGVDSKLMKWFKKEQYVRIAYGVFLTIPVIITSLLTSNIYAILACPLVVATSCLRLGSWGKIGKYDILPVDIFRGFSVGLAMSFALC